MLSFFINLKVDYRLLLVRFHYGCSRVLSQGFISDQFICKLSDTIIVHTFIPTQVARSTCVEIGATQCVHLTDSKLAFQHHQSLMRNITVITAELTFLKTSFETALADILNKDKALSTVNSNTTELQEQLTLRMSSVEAGLERVKAEIPSNTREHPIADKNIGEKVKQLEMQLVDKSTLLRRQGEQIQELRRVVDHIQSTNEKRGFKGGASGVKDVRASGVKDGRWTVYFNFNYSIIIMLQ